MDKKDDFSGDVTRQAVLLAAADYEGRRGQATITATCGVSRDSQKVSSMALDLVYQSMTEKGLGFETYTPPVRSAAQMQADAQRRATEAVQDAINNPQGIMDAYQKFLFEAQHNVEAQRADHTPTVAFRRKDDGQESTGFSRSKFPNELLFNVKYSSENLVIELPLANGDKPVLHISLQDQALRQFISDCPGNEHIPDESSPVRSVQTYTANGFQPVLAAALSEAAVHRGMDAHAYDKEVEYIDKAVKLCSSVTPEMALNQADRYLGPSAHKRDVTLSYDYAICQGGDGAAHFRLGRLEDVSKAAGRPHEDMKGDVMLYLGQTDQQTYNGGDGFEIAIDILSERGRGRDNVYSEVLSGVHIQQNQPTLQSAKAPSHFGDRAACKTGGTITRSVQPGDVTFGPTPAFPDIPIADRVVFQPPFSTNVPGYHFSGGVSVETVVGTDGKVCAMTIRGHAFPNPPVDQGVQEVENALDDAAMDAISKWEFKPQMLGSTPTLIHTIVNLKFSPDPAWRTPQAQLKDQPHTQPQAQTQIAPAQQQPVESPTAAAFRKAWEQGDAPVSQPPPNSQADAYYTQGMRLYPNSTVDLKTGKLTLAPGCESAFRKYLQLAPKGEHAEEVRHLLENAGIHLN